MYPSSPIPGCPELLFSQHLRLNRKTIFGVIKSLRASGSTHGSDGLELADRLAGWHFEEKAVNRIMLFTDGDFNIGLTQGNALSRYISEKRSAGIFLSEAQKALVQEAQSTLYTIAKDVKFQVEFNPNRVAEYRLIGYEKRLLAREDFHNDSADAGDIGAGHTVTVLHEFNPVEADLTASVVDDLWYGIANGAVGNHKKSPQPTEKAPLDNEYAFLKMRRPS
ncbi:unnamed protein product [Cylindrotheca closterium]|uniref:Uncharacterized protein YfbK C-terminal domain-containing protein n=1 Tax=Cylindrotheca closterium TaxID=2856 RepID=A0AAD2JGP5_9STRA|nr:unnamed protein product [Cylindrotheca closterium]